MGLKGTVSSLPDAKGNLFVQCGIMRTSTNIKDLVRIEEATITTPTMSKTNTGKLRMSKSFSVSPRSICWAKRWTKPSPPSINIWTTLIWHIWKTSASYTARDRCLRKAIQQHLKRIKYVKSFRQGEYGEGDAGVTIVEFKNNPQGGNPLPPLQKQITRCIMVNKQKILIVDDDANIAELISLYLTKECFDTMIVEDGESALRAVDTFAPNLILLDLMLPGIDGYQVCREVRSNSSVPIIMLSAKGEIF